MESRLFTILKSQWLKGFYIAVGGAVIDTLYQVVEKTGDLSLIDYKQLATVAVIAGISYIKITFLSNSKRQVLKK
jgi:hypothetical protein